MSLRDLMEEDLDSVLFDPEDGFSEAVTYNGNSIYALPEIGLSLQKGNSINTDGTSDRAVFGIRTADVSTPKAGDVVVHNGKTWRFVRLISTEAGMSRAEFASNMSPHNARR